MCCHWKPLISLDWNVYNLGQTYSGHRVKPLGNITQRCKYQNCVRLTQWYLLWYIHLVKKLSYKFPWTILFFSIFTAAFNRKQQSELFWVFPQNCGESRWAQIDMPFTVHSLVIQILFTGNYCLFMPVFLLDCLSLKKLFCYKARISLTRVRRTSVIYLIVRWHS